MYGSLDGISGHRNVPPSCEMPQGQREGEVSQELKQRGMSSMEEALNKGGNVPS